MFHWVTGVPFEAEEHAGAYDDLTLWEQIDGGAQYTPAKKRLLVTPIALCVDYTPYSSLYSSRLRGSSSRLITHIMSLGPSRSASPPLSSTSSRSSLRYTAPLCTHCTRIDDIQ